MRETLEQLIDRAQELFPVVIGSDERAAIKASTELHDLVLPSLPWRMSIQAAHTINVHAQVDDVRAIANEDIWLAVMRIEEEESGKRIIEELHDADFPKLSLSKLRETIGQRGMLREDVIAIGRILVSNGPETALEAFQVLSHHSVYADNEEEILVILLGLHPVLESYAQIRAVRDGIYSTIINKIAATDNPFEKFLAEPGQ